MNTTDISAATLLDVSGIPCHEKHALIFQRWADLPVGEYFILANGHDPVGLYFVFAERFPNLFTWEHLERGPSGVKIKITRLAASSAAEAADAGKVGCETVKRDGPALNLRGIPPTEATARLLAAANNLPLSGALRAITDDRPVHLLAECDAHGVAHRTHQQTDGSWLVTLWRR